MSFTKSFRHTAFSTSVLDALCKMLEALFDAQIKIVQFCQKHTSFPFPTSDWVAQLFKNKMFVPFTPMEVLSITLWKWPCSLMPFICVVFHKKCFLCLFKQCFYFPIMIGTHLSLPSLSTQTVALLSSVWHFALCGRTGLSVLAFCLGVVVPYNLHILFTLPFSIPYLTNISQVHLWL